MAEALRTPKCKLALGSISYLKEGMQHFDARVANHQKQLTWLESAPFVVDYHEIRIAWSKRTESRCSTDLDVTFVQVEPPSPPGASRNQLLKVLYESDYDYMVCMDDDHVLDPADEGFDFLCQLTPTMAQEGNLILFKPHVYVDKLGLKRLVEKRNTPAGKLFYLMHRAKISGDLQICCIPNLVKYGKEPVWFDAESYAQEDEIPEDGKFLTDWIAKKYPVYLCDSLMSVALDNYVSSSLYTTKVSRAAGSPSRIKVWNAYVQKSFKGRINSYRDLYKMNPAMPTLTLRRTLPPGKFLKEDART